MKILLAVSGGIDSMYLANRSLEDAGGLFGLDEPLSFAVAHCNFALRGSQSDADEAFVRAWCLEHGIHLHVRRFDTTAFAAQRHISIEMAARDLRYSWFRELCRQEGYDRLAVAHNANDNAETLILNLLRGTGLKGICGMEASGELVLRPMLGISREQILSWMQARGLGWREDGSNADDKYRRNLIRNEVFPIFKGINPSFVETLGRDISHFAEVEELAQDYVLSSGLSAEDIDTGALMSFKHWRLLLFRLVGERLNSSQLESLCRSLSNGRSISGKRFGPYIGVSDRLVLTPSPTEERAVPEWSVVDIAEVGDMKDGGYVFLDADKVGDTPLFRHWKDGDWMVPLGMKGRKKLSDIFNDLGYSIPRKEAELLVAYPGDESRVAAMLCGRIDDSVKLSAGSERVLKIRKFPKD